MPGDISARLSKQGPEALLALSGLIGEATALATAARRSGAPDARSPAPLIAIDQGEEMFATENAAESQRFLDLLAAVVKEPASQADPYLLVTIRADSVEALLQRWPALGLDTPESHYLPPLPPSAHRDVIVKPAEVYTERVRRLSVEPALRDALARDATGADALPLLAFTLEKLFHEFGADGNLTNARYDAMGGIGGSIDRALAEAQRQAGSCGTSDSLRRLMVPGLATWDPAANAAKRLVARESDLLADGRAALTPLANALVTNRLLTRGAGTVEVAHEALLRRPPIDGWLEMQKDALKLLDDILKEAKDWSEAGRHAEGLVRRGARLEAARALQADVDFAGALAPTKYYLAACGKLEDVGRRKARRTQRTIFALMAAAIAGLAGIIMKAEIIAQYRTQVVARLYSAKSVQPFVLSAAAERELKPKQVFRECAKDVACPEMVVLPVGDFVMGSPEGEDGHVVDETQHPVRIEKRFAVSKYAVTVEDWNACVTGGGCDSDPDRRGGFVGEKLPAVYISWSDAQQYVTWLSQVAGKTYRLLSESEFEYAARAGSKTAYPWGNDIGTNNANCKGCGSKWDGRQPAPVGSFAANDFGLHDMHGNVWQWVQNCYQEDPDKFPKDEAAPFDNPTCQRVVRGGSWDSGPQELRSALRYRGSSDSRSFDFGFRVARTLILPSTL